MDILNNPLLLVAASAAISALITAAIETAITNRQKATLERQLEEIRHKHALEVEQLRFENTRQLETEAVELRRRFEHERDAAEQRLIKLPNAIAAAYQLRYLYFDLITTLSSEQGLTKVQASQYFQSLIELSKDLLQIDDPDIRREADKLVTLCQVTPSIMARFHPTNENRGLNVATDESIASYVTRMRQRYEEIKEAQTRLLEMIKKSDEPPSQE